MTEKKSSNVVWQQSIVSREDREKLNNHKGAILWFTGLSGSGKSTLANAVEQYLYEQGARTFVLDGDNVRHGLCSDLGFSDDDREENIRRIGEIAKLFAEAGIIVLTAFISPFVKDRTRAREVANEGDFFEIYCDCSLDICEGRDVKGLYKKARSGEIPEFTGISSPYEAPEKAEANINTGQLSIEDSVSEVLQCLRQHGVIKP